jgi:threonine/homoserine/homoserine lactone efflux protein
MGQKEPVAEPAPAPTQSDNLKKWKYTLITTVIFLLIANPYTYMIVQSLLGKFIKIASPSGCPTIAGLLVHAVVFTLLLRLVMDLKV